MDSLNIHQMDIFASKAIQKKYYPNLWIEEWEFKNQQSALTYGTALGNFINAGYGLKSPTAILQRGANVFLFQTAAFVSIPELERMIKLLNPNPKMLGRNYDP